MTEPVPRVAGTAAFVSRLVAQRRPEPGLHTIDGTLLFADVSGFTRLAERLRRDGRVGAERLTEILNATFGELLEVAEGLGGDVLKFGGDALLLLFEGDGDDLRACRCAAALRRGLSALPVLEVPGGRVRLRMTQGVATGPVRLLVVGKDEREVVVGGTTVTRVLACEAAAERDQVVVDEALARRLPGPCLGPSLEVGSILRRAPGNATPRERIARAADDGQAYVPGWLRRIASQDSAHGEHRQVAIAFAGFSGADALLAAGGAGAVAELVTVARAAAGANGVTMVGSDVDRDGGRLMLVAGMPDSSEDDLHRLLLACRRIAASAPAELGVRIGVHRGSVFAATIGTPWRRTFTVMGDTVNVASRLMGSAEASQIVVSGEVAAWAGRDFTFQPLESRALKGRAGAVDRRALVDAAPGPPATAGTDLPLIGRQAELARLRRLVDVDGRAPAVVEVTGPPGVGKTRLVQSLAEDDERVTLVGLRPGDADASMRGARRLLTAVLDLPGDEAAVEAGLRALVEAHLPGRVAHLPLIGVALRLELPSTTESSEVDPRFAEGWIHALVAELLAATATGSRCVILDGGHRLDPASAALVRAIANRPPPGWALVLVSRAPSLDIERTASLELAAIDARSSIRLFEVAAGSDAPPRPVVAELCSRARGNPRVIVELAVAHGARRAQGARDGDLPDSLDALLRVRLDALAPTDRRLVAELAVLGPSIPVPLAVRVLGTGQDEIAAAAARLPGVLRQDGGRIEFEDGLVRRVAYEGLSFRRRAALHAAAAAELERLEPGASATLAHHLAEAGAHDTAWRRARAAAEEATSRFAHVEAAALLRLALDSGRRSDAGGRALAELESRLGASLFYLGDLAGAEAADARALRLTRDPGARAELLVELSRVRDAQGRIRAALAAVRRAEAVIPEVPGARRRARLRAHVHIARASRLYRLGKARAAERSGNAALTDALTGGDQVVLGMAYQILDMAKTDLGDRDVTLYRERAIAAFRRAGNLVRLAGVLNNVGVADLDEGRWSEALAQFEEVIELAEHTGDMISCAMAHENTAEIASDQGRLAVAEEHFEEALALFRGLGYAWGVGTVLSNLGRMRARAGDLDAAARLLEEATPWLERSSGPTYVAENLVFQAERLLLAGRPEAARRRAAMALDRLGPDPERRALARALRAQGMATRGPLRARRLGESVRVAREAGLPVEAAISLLALGRPDDLPAIEELFARVGVIRSVLPLWEPPAAGPPRA
jgi:class 3 adenylate cyclase/tetratricopeptide (TPR) repeat protein